MTRPADSLQVRRLQQRLESLEIDVRRGERARLAKWKPRLVGSANACTSANLAAYLAFRHHDTRDIQGSHILEGVDTLVDVLVRMETNQSKKTPRLRALQSW